MCMCNACQGFQSILKGIRRLTLLHPVYGGGESNLKFSVIHTLWNLCAMFIMFFIIIFLFEYLKLGLSTCIRWSRSPRGLPRSELRKQRFYPRGDGDGGKNSPADSSGRGTGKLHPSPRIPRIRLYILNYILLLFSINKYKKYYYYY